MAQQRCIAFDPLRKHELVVAEFAKVKLMLRQCGEDQRQSRLAAVVLENCAVHFTEETLPVSIDFVLAASATAFYLHWVATLAGAAVALREAGLPLLGQIAPQCFLKCFRYPVAQADFVDAVAVAFK